MFFGFLDILKIITIFQIFFVSVFLFLNSKRQCGKNLFLVAFVLSKALFLTNSLLLQYYTFVFELSPEIIGPGAAFQFLLGPALYFIMVELTRSKVVLKPIHLLHLLPFLFYIFLVIFSYTIYDNKTKLSLLQSGFPYSMPWFRTITLINYIQFVVYGLLALRLLAQAKETMYRISSQSVEKNIFYLKFLIYDFAIVWGINTVSMYLPLGSEWWNILSPITVINIFFVANAIVYQGLKFPQIFREEATDRQKYEKNLLTNEEKELYAKKLKEYMEKHKIYLKPTLSLNDLADELAVPPYILSQTLNTMLKQNFYDFVNNYRIEESKRLLVSSENLTILEILYQSGFNSKSVFNSAFRKYTGMTPSEFKRKTPEFSLS